MGKSSTSGYIREFLDFDDKDLPANIVFWESNNYPSEKHLYHPEIEFLFIIQGCGQYFIKDTSYDFNKNSVLIIHKNEVHNYISSEDCSIKTISLMVSPNLFDYNGAIKNIISQLQPFYHIILTEKDGVKASIILDNISDSFQNKEKFWKESIKSQIENFLFFIFKISSTCVIKSPNKNLIVQEVIDYIEQNISINPSLDMVAKHVYVSFYHLSRLFTKHVGMGYKTYLINYQINQAKRLLEETDNLISEIAFDVGFNELSSFNRNFKSVTGINPSEYRKMCKLLSK